MNIDAAPVKAFLDALDTVLNSNTFLLELTANYPDAAKAALDVTAFIQSGEFKQQILRQDLTREWGNYHFEGMPDVTGDLFKPGFRITMQELSGQSSSAYLRTMLTIEQEAAGFYSPYNNQLEKGKAQQLVTDFLDALMLQQHWRLFQLNTDFSYSRSELRKKQEMAYFEGDFASDSATLLVREDGSAFLLLTNGID